jgi:FixJ family two-component response regulator
VSPSDIASPITVLLVDADEAIRTALKFYLEIEGFAVETYADGEALLARSEFPDGGRLVLDHQLPGADGLEVLNALRNRDVRLPTVLMTSRSGRRLRTAAATAAVDVVEKPLLGDVLLERLRNAQIGKVQA